MLFEETQSSSIEVENDLAIRIVIDVHKAFFGFAQQSLQSLFVTCKHFTITDEHVRLAAGAKGSPDIFVVVFVDEDVGDLENTAGVSVIGVVVLMVGCVFHISFL